MNRRPLGVYLYYIIKQNIITLDLNFLNIPSAFKHHITLVPIKSVKLFNINTSIQFDGGKNYWLINNVVDKIDVLLKKRIEQN